MKHTKKLVISQKNFLWAPYTWLLSKNRICQGTQNWRLLERRYQRWSQNFFRWPVSWRLRTGNSWHNSLNFTKASTHVCSHWYVWVKRTSCQTRYSFLPSRRWIHRLIWQNTRHLLIFPFECLYEVCPIIIRPTSISTSWCSFSSADWFYPLKYIVSI